MRIEEQHPDVLENIEFAVARLYRRNPKMADYDVLVVYEKLVESYKAEILGREAKVKEMSGLEAELFRDVRMMCEWRLGRGSIPDAQGTKINITEPIDLATLVLCLRRLTKSVNKWHKHYGVRGYLNFMTQFVK